MRQNDVIEISSGDESDNISLSDLWCSNWRRLRSKNNAGTEDNVAAAHAASSGSRTPEPLRAGRLHCGDVGGTKMPPKDVIVISSDDESYDEQPESGPGSSSEPSSVSPKVLHTKLPQSAVAGSAACQPGQASAPDNTTRNTTAPETDAASLAEHRATRHDRRCQQDPWPPAEPCGTTPNHDGSICLPNDEWDKRYPFSREALRRRRQARRAAAPKPPHSGLDSHHLAQGPRRAASSQKEETRQKYDNRYRSPSHDHHGDSDQTSGPARRRPPVPEEAFLATWCRTGTK
ncbi:hypothetical protein C7999DRAFT_36272 [Corynascus novoguineensis]|uniref:Uncharacterized protein n=1 Tax=Corynascus novoguineensis TaxID=1126955 RepID=A0AAN7CKN1_9PEZI|nr:hypothetical protein C7999DRAFT_36272 [Corynascus novoguineensis]